MTPATWQVAKSLIADALKLPVSERHSFIAAECTDPDLQAEVLSMLGAYDESPDFLEPRSAEATVELSPGTHVGPYVILRRIGRGGMSEVFLGSDPRLDRQVALKCLIPSRFAGPDALKRIFHEARAAARITHPNVAAIYDVAEYSGLGFIVMEYVEGENLAARARRRPLQPDEIVLIARQLASALAAAHAKHVIHRDLKPANIHLAADGSVKVLDFGVARAAFDMSTTTSVTTDPDQRNGNADVPQPGTPAYMSPEQFHGRGVDERSDIYSLGVVLFELVMGSRPEQFAAPEIIRAALSRRLRSSPALAAVIEKALELQPERRFQSAAAIETALAPIASGASKPGRHINPVRWRLTAAVAAASLLGGGAAVTFRVAGVAGVSAAPIRSIAVLPFDNLNGPAQEYVSDGFTDLLIDSLSKITALRVISRTSVLPYKKVRQTVPQIARELSVEGIVEGVVQQVGDKVRVTVKLIDTAKDAPLWSHAYERASSDLFSIQNEIANDIASNIRVSLSAREREQLSTGQSANPAAQEDYLRGWQRLERFLPGDAQEAVKEFESAVRMDPTYARAYAALSHAYWALGSTYGLLSRDESYSKAKNAALEALRLDPNLPRAYAALGQAAFYYEWNWRDAEAAFKRALDLNPSDADAHELFGWYLASRGRLDDALQEMASARVLDPRAIGRRSPYAAVLFYARRYDEAIQEITQMLAVDPDLEASHFRLGRLYAAKGMIAEALAEIDRPAMPMGFKLAELALTNASAGRLADAKQALGRLENWLTQGGHIPPDALAFVYAALGNRDRAFELLNQAVTERSPAMVWLKVDPRSDPLRGDERFQRILTSMGL